MSDGPKFDMTAITLTADIASAFVSKNSVPVSEIVTMIQNIHGTLISLGKVEAPKAEKLTPAVSVRASVKPDYIICLEDGKKLKTLKRHLQSAYNMSPAEYRAKWNLPADYPMVAASYSEQRKAMAKRIGLGRKKREAAPVPPPAATAAIPAPAPAAKKTEKPAKAAPVRRRRTKAVEETPVG